MLLYFEVHSFTDEVFHGNPAGVCPLDEWIDDEMMQKIAKENGLSETAFFVPGDGGFELRWFTPSIEVDLCGHATLASARFLSAFTFGTQAWDPWTYVNAILLLASLCVLSAVLAARRVTRVEPMRVLREE